MSNRAPYLGLALEDLDTPVLLVDLDVFESNVATMAAYCRTHGTLWRPHSKCHKCPAIARLQLDAGAIGITCAKLSEAELMVTHGIGPILIANQIVTPAKLARLARLQQHQQIIVAMDEPAVVPLMERAAADHGVTIPVVIELDIGLNRVGVEPGEQVLRLAQAISDSPGLRLCGVMGYEGHVLAIQPLEDKIRACHTALELLLQAQDELRHHGLDADIVSAGGTGCYETTAAYPGITEVQAGGGVFMDAMYRYKFGVESLDFALTCLTTVTSRAASHVEVDAGFKTLSAYHEAPVPYGRGDLELRYLSAEHGVFDVVAGNQVPQVGEQLRLVVGYSDSTAVLHDRFLGVRNGRVERIWEIAGRGLLS